MNARLKHRRHRILWRHVDSDRLLLTIPIRNPRRPRSKARRYDAAAKEPIADVFTITIAVVVANKRRVSDGPHRWVRRESRVLYLAVHDRPILAIYRLGH